MRTLILLLTLTVSLSATSQLYISDKISFKKAVKNLVFEKVEYELYGTTVKTVRLSEETRKTLKKSRVKSVQKLSGALNAVDIQLEDAKSVLADYNYPLRSRASMRIESLKGMADIPQVAIYEKEAQLHEELYEKELKRLKESGELQAIIDKNTQRY
ncbi:MAG: hypothetical protein JEZ14_14895 [Marinilabiliaceae bacterium]|nr:hypothetical protein [Marinilabiliaceae bacterium]